MVSASSSFADSDIFDEKKPRITEKLLKEPRERLILQFEKAAAQDKLDISARDVEYIVDKISPRKLDASIEILVNALDYHHDDPNFDWTTREKIKKLLEGPESFQGTYEEYEFDIHLEATLIAEWSPYPEVRAVTTLDENDEIYCETLRVYIIGAIFTACGSAVDTFFSSRYPAITIAELALELLIYPVGLASQYLPDWGFRLGQTRYSLNPGKWSFKEQMLTALMVGCASGAPFINNMIIAQYNEHFFGFTFAKKFGYQISLILSTQLISFGIAGLYRVFLVYPVSSLWYEGLPYIALNRSLVGKERRENINGWRLDRYSFFWVFFVVSFVYYWLPDFLFRALSYFNWLTWINPRNIHLAAITGSYNGLGFNPIPTFDWNIIGGNGMVTPLYSSVNRLIGNLISFVAIVVVWYTNVGSTGYTPINNNALYSNKGDKFVIHEILNDQLKLDKHKFHQYSPPFYTAGNMVLHACYCLMYPCMAIYSGLKYWSPLFEGFRNLLMTFRHPSRTLSKFNDPFTNYVKRNCKEAPEWYYLVLIVIAVALGVFLCTNYKEAEIPVWTVFASIVMNFFFTIPLGMILAITNTRWEIDVLVDLVFGFALTGNGNAMLLAKSYATCTLSTSNNYITMHKQAHYCRIPPRTFFRIILLGLIICSFVQTGILNFQINDGIKAFCAKDQPQKFTCLDAENVFNAAVMWGIIGPDIVLGKIYPGMKYCFLIGAVLPFPFYFLEKKYPKIFTKVNILVIIKGCSQWGASNLTYHVGNYYIAWLFNGYIRRKYSTWWQKYNYILYTALCSGLAWSAFLMFWAVSYKSNFSLHWWGNTVPMAGCDFMGCSRLNVTRDAPNGYFGPRMNQLS